MPLPTLYPLLAAYSVLVTALVLWILITAAVRHLLETVLGKVLSDVEVNRASFSHLAEIPFPVTYYDRSAEWVKRALEEELASFVRRQHDKRS
jgi:hypothetical protein